MEPVRAEPPVCRGLCFVQCEQTPFIADELHEHCRASQAVILSEPDFNGLIAGQEMLNSYMNFDGVPLNEMHADCQAPQEVILGEPDFNELIADYEMLDFDMNFDSVPLNEDCRASQAVILDEPDFNKLIVGQEMLESHMDFDSVPLNEMHVNNTAYSADLSEYQVHTPYEKETQSYSPNTMVNDSPNPMLEAPIDQAGCASDWSPCMETNSVLMGSLSQLQEEAFETYIRQDMFDGEEEVATQHEETLSE
ncbi:hypothetical protein F5Y07DRAFT_405254 [Xylaria sp. FL0933]|nr:hypothetical protein F5Y07DRAFT_405254 [Xylaria sp. FL0933]